MELIHHLTLGLGAALLPLHVLCALAGCVLGLLLALLPGLGPVAAMAMVLPATYALQPLAALILLGGLYLGMQHGRAMATMLLQPQPREAALRATRLAAFTGAGVGGLLLLALVPLLADLALQFGPAESCALMVLGLFGSVVLASGALVKAMAMGLLGLLLGLVGTDLHSGVVRFTLDVAELGDGIGLVLLAMGVFAYGEIFSQLDAPRPADPTLAATVPQVVLRPQGLKALAPATLRGTALGVALPTGLLALLGLGLPTNAVMALLLGVLGLHHIAPGAQGLASQPELFWGLVASIWLSGLLLLGLGLPLTGIARRLVRLPHRWLVPVLVLVCALGAYSLKHSIVDIWLLALFGAVGYAFNKLDMAPAPLLLGFVLAPALEDNLRRALQLSKGDWSVFAMRPVSAGLLLLALLPVFQTRRAAAYLKS